MPTNLGDKYIGRKGVYNLVYRVQSFKYSLRFCIVQGVEIAQVGPGNPCPTVLNTFSLQTFGRSQV